ncbi:urea carboxylase [Cyphellophora europaea CBS 101466]|uniref:Urea carboxylase n=1 Tax=Cyphellophora europaea (strain CBS 101466) TaxID=1220924 RepID=W2RNQ5_CYPE1|nr:urea carboxylase [Cyphellophora europaea CBS 101466]ETN38161.1 urea carboxylase [Cyphellophora europaea CBS 101466]
MEKLKTLLVANRGEIATRIIRTSKELGIRTISIYTAADAASTHVGNADEAVLLSGLDSKAYLDGEQIVEIAKARKVDAIIPGYGFLSENTEFAKQVMDAGMVFAGPSPKAIDAFGIKHTARELAQKADVPIVPGTKGLVSSEQEAVDEANKLGYPVMLKATAGGGGMGLLTCPDEKTVRESFKTVQSRGATLFKNSGLFIEKYYPSSHHIEVQVFGNGQGKAIHFGERECSIQRRHQKVIEECPSPFVTQHPELREKLGAAAVRLAESIQYGSAGTIEYLVDDESGKFFFLEMNTRLQVEHGITELCYGVDLVELMLRQADAELQGKGGLDADYLAKLQPSGPKGAAVEARIYAENPAKDYAPSPGILQEVEWKQVPGSRIDTWIHRGTKVTANYDPLLAKAMVHAGSRDAAVESMLELLGGSKILGPPTNLDFLAAVLDDPTVKSGKTLTKFLSTFNYAPAAIDVIQGGAYTLVEDWPGRPTVGRGFSHAGPMDPLAFRIANSLVGNDQGIAGLEITLSGPELKFLGPAIVAHCGAPMEITLDGKSVPMWTRLKVEAGQRLKIGKCTGGGCRSYLAIHGGLPTIAEWFGSKSTAPMTAVGGYQGRALAAGDLLGIAKDLPDIRGELKIPDKLVPKYPDEWHIFSMPGPYDEGFITEEAIEQLYQQEWTVSHNAARGGIRLLGGKAKWARSDGGEGGAHPSNVIEYGYPVGALNWTGDDPVLFPVDAPDLGGFVCSTTIVKAEFWRFGQVKAGNKLKFVRVSYQDAIAKRKEVEEYLSSVDDCCENKGSFDDVFPLKYEGLPPSAQSETKEKAIIHQIPEKGNNPLASYRQGGDDFILVDYGHGAFNLNYRCRAVALYRKLKEHKGDISFDAGTIYTGMACGNSLMVYYNSLKVGRDNMMKLLLRLEEELGDLSEAKYPSRIYKLPIAFNHTKQKESLKRYMETQRPYASYLPDPAEFVAENNAFTERQLRDIFTKSNFMTVAVGFFVALPLMLPIDPRQRMQSPKMNPSRIHTPEGQVGWGGACMALYNVESPGGYMNIGISIPCADILGYKNSYSADRPWLIEDFDQVQFYEVSEEEYNKMLATFHSGRYVYEVEDGEFDMKEHNKLLEATKDEVKKIREEQSKAQAEMTKKENELLEKLSKEKEAGQVSMDTIDELLNDPDIIPVEAPLNANVWKVEVKEGDTIKEEQIVSILEAMKLEIPVKAEASMAGATVEKMIVKPTDVVDAGKPLMLLRKAK